MSSSSSAVQKIKDEDFSDFLNTYKPETAKPENPTNKNTNPLGVKKAQMFHAVGKQTSKPLTSFQEKLLKLTYYENAFCVGRDALWYKIRNRADAPSWRQVADWVARQKVQQRYALTRKTGLVNSFVPPLDFWHGISTDLIDYTNRPSGGFRYVLVVVDNLSRFMITRAIKSKEADDVAVGLDSIFSEIQKKFQTIPKYSFLDNGNEWRGSSIVIFEKYGVERRLSPGGAPQAQALVERALGTLKLVMARMKDVKNQGWAALLSLATKNKNNMYHRTLRCTPSEALQWDASQRKSFQKKLLIKTQPAQATLNAPRIWRLVQK